MHNVSDRAARWGVAAEYYDAFGHRRQVGHEALSHIVDAISGDRPEPQRLLPATVVARLGRETRIRIGSGDQLNHGSWQALANDRVVAGGAIEDGTIELSQLKIGTYQLRVSAGDRHATATLLAAPATAWQGPDWQARWWMIAVQLYGVRSRRNWGHGDFTDLADLLRLAARVGAAGIGLNPLHALYDDRPEQASPYSPNSRLFLNPLYIDVGAIPEFPGIEAAGFAPEIERLRGADQVDYAGVGALKRAGLRLAYERFRQQPAPDRLAAFATFRQERGRWLPRFACFEHLRRRFQDVWWNWPLEWRRPSDEQVARLRDEQSEEIEFYEYVQWIAHEQILRCCATARELGLPIGLYVDVAVGVESGGADAWSDQDAVLNRLSVGAPPDILNTAGQNWGLSGFSPIGLEAEQFDPFRQMLKAAMRYAGAIRIDHVLGLRRLFVIPHGMSAQDGTYVQLPFEALLAVAAQESVQHHCIVIGEDLGTVPEGFRETMADWGLWSYLVLLFERGNDGSFKTPSEYKANALASFSTHDLPTFAGWSLGHDLEVKRALAIDPGETDADRSAALRRLRHAIDQHNSGMLDFAGVMRYLAATPTRLVVVAMEDALEVRDQPNLPGTVDQHPNWRQRLPVWLEELPNQPLLHDVAHIMANAGRRVRS
jgi:4-alpha-glucanotransferase